MAEVCSGCCGSRCGDTPPKSEDVCVLKEAIESFLEGVAKISGSYLVGGRGKGIPGLGARW